MTKGDSIRVLMKLALALSMLTTVVVVTVSFSDQAGRRDSLLVVSRSGSRYWLNRLEIPSAYSPSTQSLRDLAEHRRWSPDGTHLAFISYWSQVDGQDEIYVASSNSGTTRNLSRHPGIDHSPAWSPDSSQLAFVSNRTGDRDIFVVGVDGENLRNVTNNAANDYNPSWSPDGRLLAFISDRDGNQDIYVVDPATSQTVNLSRSHGAELELVWVRDMSQ